MAGKAKAGASVFGSKIKAAAQIAAKQAEKAAIVNLKLPEAYQALGRQVQGRGAFRAQFADLHEAIEGWQHRLEALRASASNRSTPGTSGEKTRAMAGAARDLADSKALEARLHQAFVELGRSAFEALGQASGPPELVDRIAQLRSTIAAKDAEIAATNRTYAGNWITPGRILGGGIASLALAAAMMLIGPGRRAADQALVERTVLDPTPGPPRQSRAGVPPQAPPGDRLKPRSTTFRPRSPGGSLGRIIP